MAIVNVPTPQPAHILWAPFYGAEDLSLDRVNAETVISVLKIMGTRLKKLTINRSSSLPFSPNYEKTVVVAVTPGIKFSAARNDFAVEHDARTNSLKIHQTFEVRIPRCTPLLPPQKENRFTLVLDMDETLIHAMDRKPAHYDLELHYAGKVLLHANSLLTI